MDRDMLPRASVRISLVKELLDKGRDDMLAAVMSFICNQMHSSVPCSDTVTLRIWARRSPQWFKQWGPELIKIIPRRWYGPGPDPCTDHGTDHGSDTPLGGYHYGFPEPEEAWATHCKFSESGRQGGVQSGVSRRIKRDRAPRRKADNVNRSRASSQSEATQPTTPTRIPRLAPRTVGDGKPARHAPKEAPSLRYGASNCTPSLTAVSSAPSAAADEAVRAERLACEKITVACKVCDELTQIIGPWTAESKVECVRCKRWRFCIVPRPDAVRVAAIRRELDRSTAEARSLPPRVLDVLCASAVPMPDEAELEVRRQAEAARAQPAQMNVRMGGPAIALKDEAKVAKKRKVKR